MSGESDLSHHHKVLKQFLDISDDQTSRSQSNANRAVKAREKLLKLSSAQFKELSTDVFDELKRRIDESRGEPDFLLPKSSFHPKRNQARQKLASLPQSRFKDLVSDISYEIERRGLHQDPANPSPANSDSTNSNRDIINDKETTSPSKSLHSQNSDSHNQSQSIGIQPKKVIPTKANLTWSSDEEDDEDEKREAKKEITNHNEHHDQEEKPVQLGSFPIKDLDLENSGKKSISSSLKSTSTKEDQNASDMKLLMEEGSKMDKLITQLKQELAAAKHENDLLSSKYQSLQKDLDQSLSERKSVDEELRALKLEKQSWQSQGPSDSLVSKELDQLKAINASLRLENQSLKNSKSASIKDLNRSSVNARDLLSGSPSNSSSPRGIVPSLGSKNNSDNLDLSKSPESQNDFRKQLEDFYDKLVELDQPAQESGDKRVSKSHLNEIAHWKEEVAKWQHRYEDSRSGVFSADLANLTFSQDELKSLVAPNGLISIKLVADLQASVETFMIYVNEPSFDADLLFEKISKISILSNEIASQGDLGSLNSNENSVCLREATSHALTATRYYALYSTILPKVVVERALSEVCFSLCDLVTASKLNSDSADGTTIDPSTTVLSQRANKSVFENNDINVMPRQLRITSKLKEAQSGTSASSSFVKRPSYDYNVSPSERKGFLPVAGVSIDPSSFNSNNNSNSSLNNYNTISNNNNNNNNHISSSTTYNHSPRKMGSSSPLKNGASRSPMNRQGDPIVSPVARLINKSSPARDTVIDKSSNAGSNHNSPSRSIDSNIPTRLGAPSDSVSPTKQNSLGKADEGSPNAQPQNSPGRDQSRQSGGSFFDKNPASTTVKSLASRFSGSESNAPKDVSPKGRDSKVSGNGVSNKSSPNSRGIFDRVKQFESPSEENIKKDSSFKSSPSNQSIASRRSSLGLEEVNAKPHKHPESQKSEKFLVDRNSLELKSAPKASLSEPFEAIADAAANKEAPSSEHRTLNENAGSDDTYHASAGDDSTVPTAAAAAATSARGNINAAADINTLPDTNTPTDTKFNSNTGTTTNTNATVNTNTTVGDKTNVAVSTASKQKSGSTPGSASAGDAGSGSVSTSASSSGSGSALKPRGLFQSIRDRFTSEKSQAKQAVEDTNSESSDNDRNEVSTEKVTSTAETTPAKDMDQYDYNDSQENSPSDGKETGFFQSIKGKLTPHDNNEHFISRAPSSTASDITVRHDLAANGNGNGHDNVDRSNESLGNSFAGIQKHSVSITNVGPAPSQNPNPVSPQHFVAGDNRALSPNNSDYTSSNNVSPVNMTSGSPSKLNLESNNSSPSKPLGDSESLSPLKAAGVSKEVSSLNAAGGSRNVPSLNANGGSSNSSPLKADGGSNEVSPLKADGGSRIASLSRTDGGFSNSSPLKADGGSKEVSPLKADGGSRIASLSRADGGFSNSSPLKADGGSKEGSPLKADGGSRTVSLSRRDGGFNNSSPLKANDGSREASPLKADNDPRNASPSRADDISREVSPLKAESSSHNVSLSRADGGFSDQSPSKPDGGSRIVSLSKADGSASNSSPLKFQEGASNLSPLKAQEGVSRSSPLKAQDGSSTSSPLNAHGDSSNVSPLNVQHKFGSVPPSNVYTASYNGTPSSVHDAGNFYSNEVSKNGSPLNLNHESNGSSPLQISQGNKNASPFNDRGFPDSSGFNSPSNLNDGFASHDSPVHSYGGSAYGDSPAASYDNTSPLHVANGHGHASPFATSNDTSPLNHAFAPHAPGTMATDASSIFSEVHSSPVAQDDPSKNDSIIVPSQTKSAISDDKSSPVNKTVGFATSDKDEPEEEEQGSGSYTSDEVSDDDDDDDEVEARQRQEYRKSMAAATFNIDLFDIDDPDNTLTHVLLYLEHQTVQVISTIQSLLSAIKKPDATRGELRDKSKAITLVILQMAEATNTSMNQTRNFQLKKHGSWVVTSLEDCNHRMNILCRPNSDKSDSDFADKNFKQRLAGISFDIAKCTKELVKTVEEASLKEEISNLNAKLSRPEDDLT